MVCCTEDGSRPYCRRRQVMCCEGKTSENSGNTRNSRTMRTYCASNIFLVVLYLVTATTVASAQDIRLKQKIVPKFYKLDFWPNFSDGSFLGSVKITFDIDEYFTNLTLHGKELTLKNYTLRNSNQIDISNVINDDDNEQLTFRLASTAYKGQYILDIFYEGKIRDDMTGFYKSYYYIDGTKRWMGATQFEATYARRAFPCFDEPHFRADYNVSFYLPNEYNVISNTKVMESQSLPSGLTQFIFSTYPKMPTYLLGWIIFNKSTFVSTQTKTDNGVEYKLWAQQNFATQMEYSNNLAPDMINALVKYTGIPYKIDGKLEKMDQIAVPDFEAGAMENWGLVTYRESRLLYSKEFSGTEDLQAISMVIAHEFTHQWFGNRVTLQWWSYTWLNEAFARFFQYFIPAQKFTDWRLEEQFVVNALQVSLEADSKPSHAMTSNIMQHSNISVMFDVITYSKGASIVRMMEHVLKPTVFQKGLNKYLEIISMSVATPTDLFQFLTMAQTDAGTSSKYKFDTVMKPWTEQSGHPLVTVTRNYTSNTATVKQERFLVNGTGKETWYIPLTYTDAGKKNFSDIEIKEYLTPNDSGLEINNIGNKDSWVIFNIQHKGFYRVNYDSDNWQLLINQLRTDHTVIGPINRAQLISDVFALAQAGRLDYSVVLKLTQYLVKETDYIPWVPAVSGFNHLLTQFYGTEFYNKFKNFVIGLVEPAVNQVGFKESNDDKHTTKLKRQLLLSFAAKLGHTTALEHAKKLVDNLVKNENAEYSPDVQKALLCAGINGGNTTAWNKLFALLKVSAYPTQVVDYIRALGCTVDASLIKMYIDNLLSENSVVRHQDSSIVFNKLTSTAVGANETLFYIIGNYKQLIKYNFGKEKIISSLISGLSEKLYTKTQLTKINEFLKQVQNELKESTITSIKGTVEKMDNLFVWREKEGTVVSNWLVEAEKTTQAPPVTTPATGQTPISTQSPGTPKPDSASSITINASLLILALICSLAFVNTSKY